ncbi:DUF317 domain-containing protein [Streptomyces sp. BK239]|uniref:DUF317 domain-containing protein n=1 Tax=Streptomyces sp. BK239 TaxID=2512155 RepID=UPI00324292B5
MVRHGTHQKVWQARLGAHTPPHLVAAFTVALADPKPMHRTDSGRSLSTLDPDVDIRRTTDVLAVYVAGRAGRPRPLPRCPAHHHANSPEPLVAGTAQARPQPLTLPSPPGST